MTDQWAYDRARQLVDAQTKPGWADDNMPTGVSHAFARYIAEHEEAPVDPFISAIAQTLEHFFPNDLKIYASAGRDRRVMAERFIEHLRNRGIEIGKGQP